jgi:hypothetical protein
MSTILKSFTVGAVLSGIASSASAELFVASSQSVFNELVENFSGSVVGQTFSDYSGYYATGLSGGSGDAAWTAEADGGLFADDGVMSTDNPAVSLTFNFSSANVFAVGGNFFNTNRDFSTGPGLVKVVAEGVSFILSSSPSSFAGFVSSSGSISSISIVRYGASAAETFASTNSLSIGVIPAPGAIAVLGVAGLSVRRRRA